jgi:hypothetical protein
VVKDGRTFAGEILSAVLQTADEVENARNGNYGNLHNRTDHNGAPLMATNLLQATGTIPNILTSPRTMAKSCEKWNGR